MNLAVNARDAMSGSGKSRSKPTTCTSTPQLSRLLDRAHAGEEIVIAKNGEPYARLVPLEKPKARQPGLLQGKVEDSFFDPLPEEELGAWES